MVTSSVDSVRRQPIRLQQKQTDNAPFRGRKKRGDNRCMAKGPPVPSVLKNFHGNNTPPHYVRWCKNTGLIRGKIPKYRLNTGAEVTIFHKIIALHIILTKETLEIHSIDRYCLTKVINIAEKRHFNFQPSKSGRF